MEKVQKYVKMIMIRNLKRKGYDYYTITVDGKVVTYVFNRNSVRK